MVDINPPILTTRVKDISTFYHKIKNWKGNENATTKDIFEFIEANGDVCIQTLDMFRDNFKHNLYLTVLPFYLKYKKPSIPDIKKHIEYMDERVSEIRGADNDVRKATTDVLLKELMKDLPNLNI